MKLYLVEVRWRRGDDGKGRWVRWQPIPMNPHWSKKAAKKRVEQRQRNVDRTSEAQQYRVTTWEKER